MALILNIETSSAVCSVCLARNGEVIAMKETTEEQNHASVLTLFIQQLINEQKISFADLSAVAISAGPGSYTGLRIGTSTAKGLCYALNIPLIAIDTLEAMATGYIEKYNPSKNDLLCPIIDARRMEVYYALYNSSCVQVVAGNNTVLDETFLLDYRSQNIHYFGTGAFKIPLIFPEANNHIINDFMPNSTFLAKISYQYFIKNQFENVAYFEPNYIKPVFIPGGQK